METTSWMDVIVTSAMPIIDDVRWQEELATSPALFFRAKSVIVPLAVSVLTHPLEFYQALVKNIQFAEYGDTEWISTAESKAGDTVIQTEYVGYDVVSCVIRSIDKFGNTAFEPYALAYDAETGEITFPQQEEEGTVYQIDFYKDGRFDFELSPVQKRLVGLAIACIWDERFSRNWLNIQMKLKDSTFSTVNESNYMQTVQNRLVQNQKQLSDEMRRYEQDCAYADIVPITMRRNLF